MGDNGEWDLVKIMTAYLSVLLLDWFLLLNGTLWTLYLILFLDNLHVFEYIFILIIINNIGKIFAIYWYDIILSFFPECVLYQSNIYLRLTLWQ